ncbi:HlyD family secretion protein [Sphingopyxis yananensis]|uniref:HlyD family secretion protein n=1 Tax=Sphingopyxis yananensis TaxID=2886687 RepID=UPI001D1073B2|nr:HlyD family efflux transporter periplasmic adaptor subunit [Sphingopyxis yananensis]MCC2603216.1 HlyD family efflux transporter periplasmic adaptor subunit [Sphingopyxis yananensis]
MQEQSTEEHASSPLAGADQQAKRKKLFGTLGAAVLLIGGGYIAYDTLIASQRVSTDNAYVGANIAQITPLVAGPVANVLVQDAQQVRKGDILVILDDTDAKLALAQAEAALANAQRHVRGLLATDGGLGAQIAARDADGAQANARVAAARADLERARVDYERRQALSATGGVSGEELTSAKNAFSTANANVKAAEAALALANANRQSAVGNQNANRALIGDSTPANHPDVLAARAARDQAQVNLDRSVIRAPVDGIVSRRQVQIGQRVQPGAMLMVVVPINDAYVDANFKEVELAKVRPGQPVTLTADLYGKDVRYNGKVVGFSGGTGAAFAVVPAQNATGNWIKVVQRVPVRIALDPKQLQQHPLRVGLSMHAEIDVSQ